MAADIPGMFTKVNALGQMPGTVFRGANPFLWERPETIEPKQKKFLQEMATNKIGMIVLLCPDEECLAVTSINLREWYIAQKFQVMHLPIVDGGVPDINELRFAADKVIVELKKGTNVAVHCQAGIGRTGLFLATLAKKVHKIKGNAAIELIRKELKGALETKVQMKLMNKV